MKTGLFFGSFNPVHVGHMIIANYMATRTELEEVWLVVSPQNPFKKPGSLAPDYDRLHLVRLAIGDTPKLKASDVEFNMPKPSYTIDTLAVLRDQHPDREFALIMGG
ncbi:MAG: nicotinate-nucleotide adenylyltransferase, partial [Bacteroidota bacterium]